MAVRMGRGLIEKQHVPCSLAHARRCLLADAQLPAMRLLPLKDLCPAGEAWLSPPSALWTLPG